MKKCIFVVGMHRSGSSMMTGIVNMCGAFVGPNEQLRRPGKGNPKGFFENNNIMSKTQKLMADNKKSYNSQSIDSSKFSEHTIEKYKKAMKDILLNDFFQYSDLIVIKDLKISRMIPIWTSILHEINAKPMFVVIFRHPKEVFNSYRKNKFDQFTMKEKHISRLWQDYYNSILRDTDGYNTTYVHYNSMLENPRSYAKKILQFMGKKSNETVCTNVMDFVDADLNRNKKHHVKKIGPKALDIYIRLIGLDELAKSE